MSPDLIYNDLMVVGAIAVLMAGAALKVWPMINRNKSWQASVDLKLNELKNNMEHKFESVEERNEARFKAVEEKQKTRDDRMSKADQRDEMFAIKNDEIIKCLNEIKTNQAVMQQEIKTIKTNQADMKEQIAALASKIEKSNG